MRTGSVTPGAQYNVFFEIDQPTVEEDAHELIRSDFIPAMAEAGYTFEAESDGIYMFVLDADPCGRAEVSVVWPPPTSGAPKELCSASSSAIVS